MGNHRTGIIARAHAALLAPIVFLLAACSAGVSAPPPTPEPGTLAITPGTATLFSELPTSFVVTGGTAPYFVTSSNQAAVPVIGTIGGSTFTVIPNQVGADTPVTLTVRDSANSPPATASLTVRPRLISNTVTVIPSPSQPAACGTSVCAGGDAEVRATLTLNGLPLEGRTVRFEVLSGDARLITSPPGVAETLSTSATTTTDSSGTARMRIRVLNDATAQTALLQITDLSSGSVMRTAVPIAPSTSTPLNAQPTEINFVGPNSQTCATGISADVIVFGGRPPYQISMPGSFTINRDFVTFSGGRFTVTANGQCVANQAIAIVDSNNATVTVTASNSLGSIASGTPLAATPTSVRLDTCNSIATVTLAGGRGPGTYRASARQGSVTVTPISFNEFAIQRATGIGTPGSGPATSPVSVGFTDGQAVVEVTVTLTGAALQACP